MQAAELDEVLAESEPRMRGFFRRRCRNPSDVDDLVQECVVAVLSSHQRFAGRSSLTTWIYAICRNVYRNYVYYGARDEALIRRLREPTHEAPGSDEDRAEKMSGVRSILRELPCPDQLLYRLYYVEGRQVLEIARITGRPAGTVKYLLHRLRGRLRALLTSEPPGATPHRAPLSPAPAPPTRCRSDRGPSLSRRPARSQDAGRGGPTRRGREA